MRRVPRPAKIPGSMMASIVAGRRCVVRGGDWHVAAVACRSAGRSRLEQARYLRNLGFRCAKASAE